MVSLIEHESDARTPFGTAWLLAGPSAALFVLLAVLIVTIDYEPAWAALVRPTVVALGVGAVASVGVGLLRPQAWILAVLLVLVHVSTWLYCFALRARHLGIAGLAGTVVAHDSKDP